MAGSQWIARVRGKSARFCGLRGLSGGLSGGMGLQEVAVVALARLAPATDCKRVGVQPADRRADDREGRGFGWKTEVLIYPAHVS
jgi:hypothetical protein